MIQIYIQLKEGRFTTGFGIDLFFPLTELLDIYVNAGIAYSYGYYSGVSEFNETTFPPVFSAGVVFKFGSMRFRGGYQYLNISNVPYNRIHLGIMVFI